MPVDVVRAPGHDRERSLGWLAVAWIEHFAVHGPGDIQGRPLRGEDAIPLTTELAGLLVDAYALDAAGRRLYDSVFYSRPKGTDKSGQAARIALFEALGPCRFAGWAEGGEAFEWHDFRHVYEPGEAMGRPVVYPFLRCMATEEGQTGNTYEAVRYNLAEGPLREAFTRRDDVGLTRTYLPGGGEIRPSTASSAAKDGGKETWTNFDETHLYVLPELRRMYDVVRRNLTKRRDSEPWSFETSTMYAPGAGSIAERSHELAQRIRKGEVRRARFLFDHRQAPPDVDLASEASLRAGLREAYGDAAGYADLDRIISEIWDVRNDVADSRRYFLNQVTAFADAWVSPQEWDALARPDLEVGDGALVTLGLDGSISDDHTALIGCLVESGHLFRLGIWNPEQHGGEVPREAVDAAVEQAFTRFDVVGFYSDVQFWEAYIDRWEQLHGDALCVQSTARHPIAWDMRGPQSDDEQQGGGQKAVTRTVEAFHAAILEGVRLLKDAPDAALPLTHDGDPTFREHVVNARNRPNRHGMTFGKEAKGSPKKVDALAGAVLARQARQDYLALPDSKKRRNARSVYEERGVRRLGSL